MATLRQRCDVATSGSTVCDDLLLSMYEPKKTITRLYPCKVSAKELSLYRRIVTSDIYLYQSYSSTIGKLHQSGARVSIVSSIPFTLRVRPEQAEDVFQMCISIERLM